jgi:ABC-type transporter MlaC component
MRVLPLALVVLAAPLAAAAAPSPVARTEALLAAFQEVKVKPGENAAATRAANGKAFAALDDFLDFDTLTEEPIRPHLAKLTPAQRKEFTGKFRELIRLVAYPDTGEFLRKAQRKVGSAREVNGAQVVDVDLSLPEEDLETRVSFHWKEVRGALRLVDVSFDGDSLIRDYSNQFGRILEKEGGAGLLKKADEKLAELTRPKK